MIRSWPPTGLLLSRFGRFFDQRRNFFGTREKDDVVSGELDRLGLGSAAHESLEIRIDHPILLSYDGVAPFLRPRSGRDLGVKFAGRGGHLRNRHEMRSRLGYIRGEVLVKRFRLHCHEPAPDWANALGGRRASALQVVGTFADLRLKGRYVNQAPDRRVSTSFGDDHPTPAMAHQYARPRSV